MPEKDFDHTIVSFSTRNFSNFNSSSGATEVDNFTKSWLSLTIIGIAVLAGNAMVCTLFARFRPLRTVTNTFVVSFAFSNALVAIVLLPWIAEKLPGVPYVIAFILFASLFNFCAVTYDRYQAVLHSLTYRAKLTRYRVHRIIALAWSAPIVLTLVPLCWERADNSTKEVADHVYAGLLVLIVTVFSFIVFVAYARVFKATRRQLKLVLSHSELHFARRDTKEKPKFLQQSSSRRKFSQILSSNIAREVKASRIFALIGITFVICWFPVIIINAFWVLGLDHLLSPVLSDISLFSLVSNSLIDPIIYSLLKSDFRRALKSLLTCSCKGS